MLRTIQTEQVKILIKDFIIPNLQSLLKTQLYLKTDLRARIVTVSLVKI